MGQEESFSKNHSITNGSAYRVPLTDSLLAIIPNRVPLLGVFCFFCKSHFIVLRYLSMLHVQMDVLFISEP
jgi:hypothetical protein